MQRNTLDMSIHDWFDVTRDFRAYTVPIIEVLFIVYRSSCSSHESKPLESELSLSTELVRLSSNPFIR